MIPMTLVPVTIMAAIAAVIGLYLRFSERRDRQNPR
jgi:hypothetical protein